MCLGWMGLVWWFGFVGFFFLHSRSSSSRSPSKMNQKNSSGFSFEFTQANLRPEECGMSRVQISTTWVQKKSFQTVGRSLLLVKAEQRRVLGAEHPIPAKAQAVCALHIMFPVSRVAFSGGTVEF